MIAVFCQKLVLRVSSAAIALLMIPICFAFIVLLILYLVIRVLVGAEDEFIMSSFGMRAQEDEEPEEPESQ